MSTKRFLWIIIGLPLCELVAAYVIYADGGFTWNSVGVLIFMSLSWAGIMQTL